MRPGVLRRLKGQDLVGQQGKLVPGTSVSYADHVNVAVHEAGHGRLVLIVDLTHTRPLGGHDLFLGTNGPYGVSLHQYRGALYGRPSQAVDHARSLEECEVSVAVVHSSILRA